VTVSKNINNPVGMGGGQRKKQSRAERQNNGPHRNLDRQSAADQKTELVRKMREKATAAEGTAGGRVRTATRGSDPAALCGLCCRTGRGPSLSALGETSRFVGLA
jgi:hypothetical protein